MDRVALKLAALNAAPASVRRWVMARRFRDEVEQTGEVEMTVLDQFIRPGDLALDVGANLGGYAYEMARLCGHVIAFEPNPAMVHALAGLHLAGVDVRACAVGDHSGEVTLHLPAGQGHVLASIRPDVLSGQDVTTITVPLIRLDDLDLPRVSFIKIDVEGAEEDVLGGALALIERDHPVFLIEIEERHNRGGLSRITDLLSARGYSGYFHMNGWQSIAGFDPVKHQDVETLIPGRYSNRRAIPYYNNFVFTTHPIQTSG